jgi:hypothetical protein
MEKEAVVMTKELKAEIMVDAWDRAARKAEKLGGKASDYIAFGLKRAWHYFFKNYNFIKKSAKKISLAAWWYCNKNDVKKSAVVDTKIVKESAKALLISFTYIFQGEQSNSEIWVGKKIIEGVY